jgi:hypothetical protein
MAEIINLRTRRKQMARVADRQAAAHMASRHGQSRAERDLAQARTSKAVRDLDGHRITDNAGQVKDTD